MQKNVRKRYIVLLLSTVVLFATAWLILLFQRKQHLIGGGLSRTFLFLLINAYLIVGVVLLYLIIRQSIKLLIERRKKVPGSAFKKNLLLAFIIFSVIPVVFVFFTAGKLITTGIDSWFDVRFRSGLTNALTLHEQQTEKERTAIAAHGQRLASGGEVGDAPYTVYQWGEGDAILRGECLREEIAVWRSFRRVNDRTTKSLRTAFFEKLENSFRGERLSGEPFDFYGSLYWSTKRPDGQRFVLVHRYPEHIRYPLIEVQNSISDYDQLKSIQGPIYWSYFFAFLLITLLILFLSIWCAFYLARGISEPIKELLLAIGKVRKGNLDVQVSLKPSDDLLSLVGGFNEMTRSLRRAYDHLEFHNKEMVTMLGHIRESVFFVNDYGRIVSFNLAAKKLVEQYLGITRFKNKKVNFLGSYVTDLFFSLVRELRNRAHDDSSTFSKEVTFSHKGEARTFRVSITVVPAVPHQKRVFHQGVLVIVEDMSEVYKINKIKTWQEAAKQMAHEIKNPLTPIQLTTQRLERKLRKARENDPALLECTQTILQQVQVIKGLVTHFSEFAKMPGTIVEPLNINEILKKVGSLYEISYPGITFSYELEKFLPKCKGDKKKMKRVIVNLFDNSVRALQVLQGEKVIVIKTSFKTVRNQIELLIADNGPGIPRAVQEKLFLPYVSSEKKNMGLGLAIVHDIVVQGGGTIKLLPRTQGATFQILLPV